MICKKSEGGITQGKYSAITYIIIELFIFIYIYIYKLWGQAAIFLYKNNILIKFFFSIP